MLNSYVLKKTFTLVLTIFIPLICFIGTFLTLGFVWSIVALLFISPIMVKVGSLMLSHPFRDMIEGKGVLALDISSTGIIKPFIVQVTPPTMQGFNGKDLVKGIWNRRLGASISPPIKAGKIKQLPSGEVSITLSEEDYNKNRMGMLHYPCLLYNSSIKHFITKDMLADMELTTFAEYQISLLSHQQEDLGNTLKDFSRSVIDKIRPQIRLSKAGIAGIIIAILLILLGLLFLPKLIPIFSDTVAQGAGAVKGAVGGSTNPITPIG